MGMPLTLFNLVPLFFKETIILEHSGCKTAYCNLHERRLPKHDGRYFVNKTDPLMFSYFSDYFNTRRTY